MNATQNLDFNVTQTVVDGKTLWQASYQPTDDRGNPVGAKTFLRASSQEALMRKIAESHANAVVFGERWKSRATRPAQPTKNRSLTATEKTELLRQANAGDIEAAERLVDNRLLEQVSADEEARQQSIVSQQFMAENPTYQPCQANANAMSAYLHDNNLAWTVPHLQLAFDTLSAQNKIALRPVVKTEEPTEATPAADKGATSEQLGISDNEPPFCPLIEEAKGLSADALRAKLKNSAWAAQFDAQLALHNSWVQKNKASRSAELGKKILKRLEGIRQ